MLNELNGILNWRAFRNGLHAAGLLGLAIYLGSRGLKDFDAALVGYALACLFSVFALTYRYTVWLSKPPTRKYWQTGWKLVARPMNWLNFAAPKFIFNAMFRRMAVQDFVLKRGKLRYISHMLIAGGCGLALAVTVPLVFGWIHFEQGPLGLGADASYRVIFLGMMVQEIPLLGLQSWFVFHALVISSFLVLPGIMLAVYRRMKDPDDAVIQNFVQDFLPLILLFSVAFSGLLLWVSYAFLEGYYYSVLAQFHAITVIGTFLYLPFGKLFHIFQRPASIGVYLYKNIHATPRAVCPVTNEEFAPKKQTEDLKEVLHELDFNYAAEMATLSSHLHWNEVSPRGRRMLIGRAHSKIRGGRFD